MRSCLKKKLLIKKKWREDGQGNNTSQPPRKRHMVPKALPLDGPYASFPPPAAAPLPTAPGAYQGEKLRERSKQEGKVMGERERMES